MKQFFFLIAAFLLSLTANAEKSLRSKIEFQVEAVVTSSDGLKLLEVGSGKNSATFANDNREINWSFSGDFKGLPRLNIDYKVIAKEDSSFDVEIVQYEKMDYDFKKGKMTKIHELRREKFSLKDFGSINWIFKASADKNIVARLVPVVSSNSEPEKYNYTPITLVDSIVTDNAGHIWDEGAGGTGEVVRFSGPYGTVFLSFTEFPGSTELGFAAKDQLIAKLTEKMTLKIRSSESIIGASYKAKVFGIYLPKLKSRSFFGMMRAENVQKNIETGP